MKIRNIEELNSATERCSKCMDAKFTGSDGRRHIVLCGGTGCLSSHSAEIKAEFERLIAEKNLGDKVTVNQVGCFGFCSQGPFVKIYPEDTLYRMVKLDDVLEIVEKDIEGGEIVDRLLYVDPVTEKKVSKQDEITFYKNRFVSLCTAADRSTPKISTKRSARARSAGLQTLLKRQSGRY